MKNKKLILTIAIIVCISLLWLTGIIPKQIAKISGTNYVKKHFPEMQLECTGVEWADVYGDYIITFKDENGKVYSCVIGPAIFPYSLGQGLFAIESYNDEIQHRGIPVDEALDVKVSYAGWSGESNIFFGSLNREKMLLSSVQHLPIYKFDTLNELESFKNAVSQTLAVDSGYDEVPSLNENTAGYDEKFFEENTLMLVYVGANSGSYRYDVNSVKVYENTLCIHVERTNNPEIVTEDMAGWFITVAILDSIVANCTEFDADLNNI